ncbi:glycosyltransferase family 28 N-terminal domain-containing protein [Cordyceps javanica]|uniref:Glycosyltransferase family 28 N-terminal domain-containing protein n=1 Tax=Cordyceps javanica TaxID=43265 RepID=A0A545VEU7_9HYPO|nr:glycosyltransferase family 28 N-terminal domain-containing protein [Cordyceps javanica]TQW11449.1 glycosyltransferase family 28 N-terminal domain protein [Cordyceps javanica]
MPGSKLTEDREPAATANVQHTILEQAEAVLAGETGAGVIQTEGPILEETDLLSADAGPNDYPPPAYGDAAGEIRAQKDGLGTSANVTEDGRVNIRINQLNRRLSQIFTPAIVQQAQSVQDHPPPPPPYVPASLGGSEGVAPPPPLNVAVHVVGSRGDVQPFVALGKVLKERYGHRVRLATHPNFQSFVQENGLEFFSIGGDPSQLMAFMVRNPSLMPGVRSVVSGDVGQRRKDVAGYIQGCWRSCYEAGDGMRRDCAAGEIPEDEAKPFVADCIIANPPSFAHVHCAEKLGIPLHIMFTMPYSPTQAFPHPLANIQASNADPHLTNYISYAMIEMLSWQGLGDIINRFRAKCLGLDPISRMWAPGMLQRLKVPHTYCWSPALIPKPKDWKSLISISGFYFLNLASEYTPSPELQAFLDRGPPPVYIGFGSIVLDDPDAMTELIFGAAKETGQRVLLSKGWGGMGANELHVPEGVFMLGNVPHDWLFKRVSCVVHHGGAGTTAAGIAAGRPTVVVPFFGDQPFWGAMVARAGAGPDPIPHRRLTTQKLAEAINFCLKPESRARAEDFARKIAQERGDEMGAQLFHQFLEVDRLRCTLAPSRPAVWRVKRTQIRLSAFAACTLTNENLLDFDDLKLFRAQEYETDQGPLDPISGGFVAACGAFGGMAMGLADIPSETVRAARLPFKNNRQRSKQSNTLASASSEVSDHRQTSCPSTRTEDDRANSGAADSQTRATTSHSSSELSINSDFKSALELKESEQIDPGRTRVRSRDISSSSNDHNFMRPTGVHVSRGLGRFTRALIKGPMDISMGLTKGCHNLPRLWGDDTVRPHAQVSDFKSGARAVGKEFGLGWYDGITGLATMPWKGAQKEGAGGFVKGVGKGMAGFIAKPTAGLMGVLGYTMKGVHKEVQGLFGTNVQSYIVASRTALGYEDWLESSDAEKQEVIVRWRLVQKYLKKKREGDDMLENILDAHEAAGMRKAAESSHSHMSTSNAHQHDNRASIRTAESAQGSMADCNIARESNTSEYARDGQSPADEILDQRVAEEELRRVLAISEAEARRQENSDLEVNSD